MNSTHLNANNQGFIGWRKIFHFQNENTVSSWYIIRFIKRNTKWQIKINCLLSLAFDADVSVRVSATSEMFVTRPMTFIFGLVFVAFPVTLLLLFIQFPNILPKNNPNTCRLPPGGEKSVGTFHFQSYYTQNENTNESLRDRKFVPSFPGRIPSKHTFLATIIYCVRWIDKMILQFWSIFSR